MKNDPKMLVRSLLYLRPSQVARRAQRIAAETALLRLRGARLLATGQATIVPPELTSPRLLLWTDRREESERIARDAAENRFEFLGVLRDYPDEIDWQDRGVPRLWRFHLNGFGFAWPLAAVGQERASGRVLARLIESHIRRNPLRRDDAWHPFVIADRLLALVGTSSLWSPYVTSAGQVARWLRMSARILARTLERDIGGNHLIREAAALVVAGRALRDPPLVALGGSVAIREAARQILADGVHEERSPSYHLEVMTDLAEILGMTGGSGRLRTLRRVLQKMADFAVSFEHPDGELPRFNDCSPWPVPPTLYARMLGAVGAKRASFPAAGYHILGSSDDQLFFDAGDPSPRSLPPHAHCDLLAVELSISGVRIVVNSGTGDYAAGPWRGYWRSTRAHNTVEVDGAEQSNVWGSFRMAERARVLEVRRGEGEGFEWVSAAHDGYRTLPSPVVHRRWVVRLPRAWVVLDAVEGAGRHRLRSFLHLHPDAEVEHEDGHVRIRRGAARAVVHSLGSLSLRVEGTSETPIENWYAPEMGRRTPAPCIALLGETNVPAFFGWVIVPGDEVGLIEIGVGSPDRFELRIAIDGDRSTLERRGLDLQVSR